MAILDIDRTPDFDIFPELAAQLFSMPIAAISLIDKDRQWFKASLGLAMHEMPREISFCAHAILTPDEFLYVPDATEDARFADNPLVVGDFGLRFYAGFPILGACGRALGALCVIDHVPRTLTQDELGQLRRLAIGVGGALNFHASVRELRKLANSDALTALGNRAGFDERLATAVEQCNRLPDSHVSLLFLDLDGFKSINNETTFEGSRQASSFDSCAR